MGEKHGKRVLSRLFDDICYFVHRAAQKSASKRYHLLFVRKKKKLREATPYLSFPITKFPA